MNSTGRRRFEALMAKPENDAIVRESNGEPVDPILRAAYHLIRVWIECGEQFVDDKGVLHLEHFCSGAREDAASYLESLGLGVNQGWSLTPNSTGLALVFPAGMGDALSAGKRHTNLSKRCAVHLRNAE